jgi:RNase H-like domain found in reverse transcriptase/Integrase zinc binding domain/Reverse transcriptase (RNA-dependent DNA polymerase)
MEEILKGIPKVCVYLVDILATGSSLEEAREILEEVFKRLRDYNVQVNAEKCQFFRRQVEYLGHELGPNRISPLKTKMECIQKMVPPNNVTELRAFLGLVNYYHRFVPNFSSKMAPLYELLKKGVKFNWTKGQQAAFDNSKKALLDNTKLVPFDNARETILATDASSFGLGAVLSQVYSGEERPVMYASCTLSPAEAKYCQLEKEALAIIFGVKRFHRYLYGRQFCMVTDHQPLQWIFGPDKPIPPMAAARVQRWAMLLSAYRYTIKYRKGLDIGLPDYLSRNPEKESSQVPEVIASFREIDEVPLSHREIAQKTKEDPILSNVMQHLQQGWPDKQRDETLQPYYIRRNELAVGEGCLLWGRRVVVPTMLRNDVLTLLHSQYNGIVRMKMLARSCCWWPKIDQEIEKTAKTCQQCACHSKAESKSSFSEWPRATENFERCHIDFFHLFGQVYFLLIDARSKCTVRKKDWNLQR